MKLSLVGFIFIVMGCTSIPKDYGMSEVKDMLAHKDITTAVNDTDSLESVVQSLLSETISINDVVQLALINNAELHKTYASLGIAAADVYEAGRIRNPILSFSQLNSNQSGERDLITLSFVTSLSDLITLPARKQFAESQFTAMKQSIAADILHIINEVQISYHNYAAALQIQALKKHQHQTATLSSRLAQRYFNAGNISERELSEQSAKASFALFESFDANENALSARKNLANLLGLSMDASWQITSDLQLPLSTEIDIASLTATANKSRLDLVASISKADRLAKQLGVTQWSRYLGDLDIGIERERETDGAKLTGPVLEWEFPIFSQHTDKKLRQSSDLKIAILDVQQLSNEIHNQVYANYLMTSNAQALVNEYLQIFIPTQTSIVASAQEEESFMLIGTFELLDTKQKEYESYVGLIKALRDYWIAYSNLMYAAGNSLSLPSPEHIDAFNVQTIINDVSSEQHNTHRHH
ncbi:MAG: TolC family protein [Gammaproteobacteria bacterium]